MTDYVLTGLVKRRAEVTGRIEALHDELRTLLAQLEALDTTILQFNPDHQVEAIRPRAIRPPADWSHKGQMARYVLSILRQAAEPLTTRDIALEMLVTRALDPKDAKLFSLMVKRVGVCLRGQRDQGVVHSEQGPAQLMVWEVVR